MHLIEVATTCSVAASIWTRQVSLEAHPIERGATVVLLVAAFILRVLLIKRETGQLRGDSSAERHFRRSCYMTMAAQSLKVQCTGICVASLAKL